MAWIESHETLARHPKTRKLARLLGEGIPSAIGRLHLLWWWAMNYAQDGDLTRYEDEDIADAVMWDGDPSHVVDALCTAGFLDRTQDGLFIHDWYDYAGKLIERREKDAERKRQARSRKTSSDEDNQKMSAGRPADVQGTSCVTLPNLTEPNQTDLSSGGSDISPVRAEIAQAYEQIYGTLPNPVQIDDLAEYVDKGMQVELVIHALRKARRNAKHLDYALGILRKQYDRGIRTVEQAEKADAQLAAGGTAHDAAASSGAGSQIGRTTGRKFSIAKGRVGEI
jgi:DnaD/phage-associated family protein